MLIGALGADLQHAAQIHAAGDDRAAGRDVRRHGFTGHARGVERTLAVHDHAVDGNAFAGTHDQNVALGDLPGVDARFLPSRSTTAKSGRSSVSEEMDLRERSTAICSNSSPIWKRS